VGREGGEREREREREREKRKDGRWKERSREEGRKSDRMCKPAEKYPGGRKRRNIFQEIMCVRHIGRKQGMTII
jgi:hypothetical protein